MRTLGVPSEQGQKPEKPHAVASAAPGAGSMEPQPPETPCASSEGGGSGSGSGARLGSLPGKPLVPTLNLSKLEAAQSGGSGSVLLARQESLGLGTAVPLDASLTYRAPTTTQPAQPYGGGLTHRKATLSGSGTARAAKADAQHRPSPPPSAPQRTRLAARCARPVRHRGAEEREQQLRELGSAVEGG